MDKFNAVLAVVIVFGMALGDTDRKSIGGVGGGAVKSKVSFPFEHPPQFPLVPTNTNAKSGGSQESAASENRFDKLPQITSENPLVSSDAFLNEIVSTDRLVLRTDDGTTTCLTCGGFTNEATGQCCQACGRLNYKACWCRSCDCLCYNN